MGGIITAVTASGRFAQGTEDSLLVKYAVLTASASGATEIVAAVAGKQIRVIAYSVIVSGTVNIKWQGGATDLTGLKYFVANGGIVQGHNPAGWFQTGVGDALNVNLSAAIAVGGEVVYVEV